MDERCDQRLAIGPQMRWGRGFGKNWKGIWVILLIKIEFEVIAFRKVHLKKSGWMIITS